jgi:hypothetical protein
MTLGPDDNLHVEGFALNVFAKADKQDHAGWADMYYTYQKVFISSRHSSLSIFLVLLIHTSFIFAETLLKHSMLRASSLRFSTILASFSLKYVHYVIA